MKAADLKFWLSEQGLTVRELAAQLDVPLKTVQEWVYRGVQPSLANGLILEEFVCLMCAHHWIIETANGPVSRGMCKLCHQVREFGNSINVSTWTFHLNSERQHRNVS